MGHKLYEDNSTNKSFASAVINTFEYIVLSIFTPDDKNHDAVNSKNDLLSNTMKSSEPNPATLSLIDKCFGVIFGQLRRYTRFVKSFNAIDWKLFCKKRNQIRELGGSFEPEDDKIDFPDELPEDYWEYLQQEELKEEEKLEKQREEDSKRENANPRDHINEIITDQTKKETKKVFQMYDGKTLTKMLRFVDIFVSIATQDEKFKSYAASTFTSDVISEL